MAENAFTLDTHPDWHAAGTELIAGLAVLSDTDDRIRLLEKVCRRLGSSLYPAFLQILLTIEQNGDTAARRLIAGTLVDCLISGRLPSGALSAWGASGPAVDGAFGQVRLLGPIEYVCAWYAQPGQQIALDDGRFDRMLGSLLNLVGSDARAAELYQRKLEGDIADPLGGALSNRTRRALGDMISAWQADDEISSAAIAFRQALSESSLLNEIARGPLDYPR